MTTTNISIFVSRCRDAGINVPIIPGLKPITSLKQIKFIPKTFHLSFPEALSDALEDCKTDAEVTQVGVEWGNRAKSRIDGEGRSMQCTIYTMGKSGAVRKILSATH